MGFYGNMNLRVKKFNILDIKMIQVSVIFLAFIFVKIIPGIMNINIWWFVVLFVLTVIKPIYVFFIK